MLKFDSCMPDMIVSRVLDIDFEQLSKEGRRFYIVDLDNTLARRDDSQPPQQVLMKIRQAQDAEWIRDMVIISNITIDRKWIVAGQLRSERVRHIAEQFRCDYIACVLPILKPNPRPFQMAMEMMDARSAETVVIGDQLSRDIKGGNTVGAFTILVNPLGPDMWLTAIVRHFKERHIRTKLVLPV